MAATSAPAAPLPSTADAEHLEVDVLIIGAGPTGLLLAGELERRSVTTHLVERNPAPLEWDRATTINTGTLEVFDGLGIVDRFLEEGCKIYGSVMHSDGEVLGAYQFGESGSRFGFGLGLSEERTERLLAELLEERGGSVSRSSKLVGLDRREEGVLATVERTSGNGTRAYAVSARFAVGCDGLRSSTRELAGIPFEGRTIDQEWGGFDATLAGWEDQPGNNNTHEANYIFLDALTPVVLLPLPSRRWRVFFRPSPSPGSIDAEAEADSFAEEAGQVIRRYKGNVTLTDRQNSARFLCHSKVAETFWDGPVLLAGDAAHVCTPIEGHGMNYGLQDSYNLAWKLALVCKGAATPALLDSYTAERRPCALSILRSGMAAEKVAAMKDPREIAGRDQALRGVFASVLGTRKKTAVMAKTELNVEYSRSPIVLNFRSADNEEEEEEDEKTKEEAEGGGDGEQGRGLAVGSRLPNVYTVKLGREDGWKPADLHRLAHRPGHTVFLVAGPDADADVLREMHERVHEWVGGGGGGVGKSKELVFEKAFTLTVHPEQAFSETDVCLMEEACARALGVGGVTVFVIRPDGFVGMKSSGRSAGHHVDALGAYLELISAGPTASRRGEPPCGPTVIDEEEEDGE